jgi:hypothetical protein
VSGVRYLAPLLCLSSIAACSAVQPTAEKPVYTDVDSLPKEIAPKTASVALPAVTAPAVLEKPAVGRARAAVLSGPQAIAAFQAAWTEEVLPATKGRTRPDVTQYSAAVAETKRLAARRMECRAGHRRADNTLGGTERTDLVFFSAIPALDRAGECWEVTVSTGAYSEILGYFDPETGALLMVWLVPEG